MQKLKALLSLFKTSKVAQNSMWLYVMQFGNMVIPLITLTYVTKVLGTAQYGIFSVAINIIGYFQVIVDYGFGLSGSRKIATNPSAENINKVFTSIFCSRALLCAFSYGALYIVGIFSHFDASQWNCINILFLTVIGAVLMQTWLFQGLQRMKFITCISLISRIISAAAVLLFVKGNDDVYLYCFCYSLTNLLIGILSLTVARITVHIRPVKITLRQLFLELKDGWYTFTTTLMSKLFSGIGVTLIAFYGCEASRIGIYSAINKLPHILVSLYLPLGQAVYPHISRLFSKSFAEGWQFEKKMIKLVICLFSCIGLGLILFRNLVITIAFNPAYTEHSLLMIPLVIWLLASIMNNCLGIQTLVASGHQKEYSKLFSVAIALLMGLNVILGYFYDIYGIAVANAIAEGTLTVLLACKVRKIARLEQSNGKTKLIEKEIKKA